MPTLPNDTYSLSPLDAADYGNFDWSGIPWSPSLGSGNLGGVQTPIGSYYVPSWISSATDDVRGSDPYTKVGLFPGTNYVLFDKAANKILAQGSDEAALKNIYDTINNTLVPEGRHADWRLYQTSTEKPTTSLYGEPEYIAGKDGQPGTYYNTIAGDYPNKSLLGGIASVALPVLGSFLLPGLGTGLGAAEAGALGAAGGSALAGALNGESVGDILKGAALSGGLSYGAGALLGSGSGQGILGKMGGVPGGPMSAAGAAAEGAVDTTPIVVTGSKAALSPAALAGIVAGAGGVALGSGLGGGTAAGTGTAAGGTTSSAAGTTGAASETPITVTGATTAHGVTAADLAAATGLTTAEAANLIADNTAAAAPKSTLSKIADALQIGGLATGLLGGAASSSGTGAKIPAGLFGSSSGTGGTLPAPNLPGLTGTGATPKSAADLGMTSPIDWYRYGYGPERNFFSNAPQNIPASTAYTGYEGPLNTTPSKAMTGFAEGGSAHGGYSHGGSSFAVGGPGDGRDDKIPAMLSDGEYVMDAETVAMLGNGSNKAGAKALDRFRVNIRKQKGRELAKGSISANAKQPEAYLQKGHK